MRSRVPECNRDGLAAREVVVVGIVGGAPANIEVEVRAGAVSAVAAQSKEPSLDHVFAFSYSRTVLHQVEVSRDGTIRMPHPDPIFMIPYMIVVGVALHDSYDPSVSSGIHARAHGQAKVDRVRLWEPMRQVLVTVNDSPTSYGNTYGEALCEAYRLQSLPFLLSEAGFPPWHPTR